MPTSAMPPKESGERCYAVLRSIHFVLKAEQLLKEHAMVHDVVPVPRAISSDCGMAIEFPCGETEAVQALLAPAGIAISRLFRRNPDGKFTPLLPDQG